MDNLPLLGSVPIDPPSSEGVVQRRVTGDGFERTDGGNYRVRTADRKVLLGSDDAPDPKPRDLYSKGAVNIQHTDYVTWRPNVRFLSN